MTPLDPALVGRLRDLLTEYQYAGPRGLVTIERDRLVAELLPALPALLDALEATQPPALQVTPFFATTTTASWASAHDHGNCELCDALDARLAAVEREREELVAEAELADHLILLQRQREQPWLERWRHETGRHDTLPDYGEMLRWIIEKADAAEQARQAADKEIARLQRVIELKNATIDRYLPCPDCRDKVTAGECQRCARQAAEDQVAIRQRERDDIERHLSARLVEMGNRARAAEQERDALAAEVAQERTLRVQLERELFRLRAAAERLTYAMACERPLREPETHPDVLAAYDALDAVLHPA